MIVRDKIVVVTGGASGIGQALCTAFASAGAARVVVADIDALGARRLANEIGGLPVACDVVRRGDIEALVESVERDVGAIDLFCSNAGIATGFDNTFANAAGAPDDIWARAWAINVMAHVHAARVLVPRMKSRGSGYFLNTVSAAGLLNQVGSAVYATTKHAAIGFAENIAITHRDDGLKVSVLCPQGVDTPLLSGLPKGPQERDGVLSAKFVAEFTLEALETERFLILPHQRVEKYMRNKVNDYDRWIAALANIQRELAGNAG